MTVDNKSIYICRAPGCGLPFTNQAGRLSHEQSKHKDICESFKGQKGETLHFKSTAVRDKAKKKLRADIKKTQKPVDPDAVVKKPKEKEPPITPPIPPGDPAPPHEAPAPVTTPISGSAAALNPTHSVSPPPTPPKPDNSHHNPNKKKSFWDRADEFLGIKDL